MRWDCRMAWALRSSDFTPLDFFVCETWEALFTSLSGSFKQHTVDVILKPFVDIIFPSSSMILRFVLWNKRKIKKIIFQEKLSIFCNAYLETLINKMDTLNLKNGLPGIACKWCF